MPSDATLDDMARIELVRTYDARGAKKSSPTYLVDRIWPRGIAKSELEYDEWIKDIAPSTELRSWFGHEPDRFPEFGRRYRDELDSNSNAAAPILEAAGKGAVVLLYSAKDTEHNQAVVLRDWISDQL